MFLEDGLINASSQVHYLWFITWPACRKQQTNLLKFDIYIYDTVSDTEMAVEYFE